MAHRAILALYRGAHPEYHTGQKYRLFVWNPIDFPTVDPRTGRRYPGIPDDALLYVEAPSVPGSNPPPLYYNSEEAFTADWEVLGDSD